MKLIEQNPFRMLGIPVNATALDLAANKSKFRLLDIGREVAFPTDLAGVLPPIERTKASIDAAERSIALPHGKALHALFWLAKPDTPLGKQGYEHLLQGMTSSAIERFSKCTDWPSRLCLATLHLQRGDYATALWHINYVIELHCDDLVHAVAGQTHNEDATQLRREYLTALTNEISASDLYAQLGNDGEVPEAMLAEVSKLAVDVPLRAIEKAISTATAADKDDAEAQLEAGRTLMSRTLRPLLMLQRMLDTTDTRYSRTVDKLANAILQCSINYFNKIEGENRTIIDNALELAKYAASIAVGKMAKEHIKHNLDILVKKKNNLPPAEVEEEVSKILLSLKKFVELPDKIVHSVTLLNETRPLLQSMKSRLGADNVFYLKLSTQIVSNALHNLIEEVNYVQKEPKAQIMKMEETIKAAWNCTKIMDSFDMESSFRSERYLPNRTTLKSMYDQFAITTQIPPVELVPPYIGSSTTPRSGDGDTNWGCIILVIAFISSFIISIIAN